MSDIIKEIISSSRYEGATNDPKRFKLNLHNNNVNFYENSLKYVVSSGDVFNRERQNSLKFRFYGNITPIINVNYDGEYSSTPDLEDFNVKNAWEHYICIPTAVNGEKGVTNLDNIFRNRNQIGVDFNNGLPAFEINSKVINGRAKFGVVAFFGHTLEPGDFVQFKFINNSGQNGTFKVVEVNKNEFYVESPPLNIETPIYDREGVVKNDITIVDSDVANKLSNELSINEDNEVIGDGLSFDGLTFNGNGTDTFKFSDSLSFIEFDPEKDIELNSLKRLREYNPQIFFKKIIRGRPSEYYVKVVTPITTVNDIDVLGFSQGVYGDDIYVYRLNEPLDLSGKTDNLGKPLDMCYLTLVKNIVGNDSDFSDLISNFENFVPSTFQSSGIETVGESNPDGLQVPGVGGKFLHSLVEYNVENLQETTINKINHIFIGNSSSLSNDYIKFSYNPFYSIKLRAYSTYIERGGADVFNIPDYAYFDPKYNEYRWRDLLNFGYFEDNGNGVNHRFLNGAHYINKNINFLVRNHNSAKYDFDSDNVFSFSGFNTDVRNDFQNIGDGDDLINKGFNEYSNEC